MGLVTREGVTKTQHAWDVDDGMTALPIYDLPNDLWRADHNRSDVNKVDYNRATDADKPKLPKKQKMKPAIKSEWKTMLSELESGNPIIVAGDDWNKKIPELNGFVPQKYRSSIKHLGYGYFIGETEHGSFKFDGGGAMKHVSDDGQTISWSILQAPPEVLNDLGYKLPEVKKVVASIIKRGNYRT